MVLPSTYPLLCQTANYQNKTWNSHCKLQPSGFMWNEPLKGSRTSEYLITVSPLQLLTKCFMCVPCWQTCRAISWSLTQVPSVYRHLQIAIVFVTSLIPVAWQKKNLLWHLNFKSWYDKRQSNKCPLWYQQKSYRLTSSSFGRIAKRKNKFESLATQLSHTSIPSLRQGVEHEDKAHCQYEQELHKSHPMLKVFWSGLWIDTERSWLAWSPDGLVYDQDELLGVLETKCPFSARKGLPLKQLKSYCHFLARWLVETYPWRETMTTFKCKASLPSPMHSGVIFVCTHHMGFLLNRSHLMSHSGSVVRWLLL